MTDSPLILAIDLGTSGPKVALVTATGRVLGGETAPTKLYLSEGGGAEQDPEDWWEAIVTAATRLHERGLGDPARVVAVGVTSQWAGTVPVDAEGRALGRAVIWMDSRGAKYIDELVGGPVRVEGYAAHKLWTWIRRTGGAPSLVGKEPLAHILFLRHERPQIYRDAVKLLEPKDYLVGRLTGRAIATYDSIALHWITDNRDVGRIDYDPALLRLAGLPRDKLPELCGATDVVGTLVPEAARALGLSTDVKVVGGTPDVQSAAIGSGAVRDRQAHVYLGTSSWLTCHVPFKKTDLRNNMASLPSALPGRYFVANEQETAGACLSWLRDNLLHPDDALGSGPAPDDFFVRLDQAAASAAPGAGGVLFTPWLYGERCPIADHAVRAAFINLSLTTTRADMLRAVLEGVALNSRWLLEALERFVGQRLEPIRIIGGGARSALWCQIYADVLGREIEQVEDALQCNARGAALVASLGLGLLEADDIPRHVGVSARFAPRTEHRTTYDRLFHEYRTLYRRTRAIYARLHQDAEDRRSSP
ncbi:xylulokinase [Paraliomyxa miuraensis]|uniref:xylulokinase n=1 Tax=Paraliomyxa miuraensis TaxID=376150 RepID=UPI002256DB76|nr:FGGY-family carbohydrate kinase [Paraliomyxa miuraensis]MCX4241941.1 FGGY-family carbohydrate kinase [Paraliomyxa miuraensis]